MSSTAPDSHADANRAQRTVLYVEDHPVNVLLMQALFGKRPHLRLVVAVTGEAGWRAALEQRPDLLLIDLHLPDCHGADLLRHLRAVPHLADVPAVAVTADTTVDVQSAGFAEIWRKPLDVPTTLARLDHLLADAPAHDAGTAVAAGAGWPGARVHPRAALAPVPFSSLAED